ncbi:hypothetical protein FG05_35046 [Fusarium graminearum]|nr:hypothetical protein FG05_35046 [Fusarium graminearum]
MKRLNKINLFYYPYNKAKEEKAAKVILTFSSRLFFPL